MKIMTPFDVKEMEKCKLAAQTNLMAAQREIDTYRVDLEKRFKIPIEIKPSPRPLGVGATTHSFWRQTRAIDCHTIFVEPCNSGQAPYILSQSLMQIELECMVHEAGLWRCALTAQAAGENILNELFEPLISKSADPARRELMRNRAARLTRLFSSQVRALPLLMTVERRLYDRFPILRPAQFVRLNVSTGLKRDELNGLEAPPQLLDALWGIHYLAGWNYEREETITQAERFLRYCEEHGIKTPERGEGWGPYPANGMRDLALSMHIKLFFDQDQTSAWGGTSGVQLDTWYFCPTDNGCGDCFDDAVCLVNHGFLLWLRSR